MIIDTHAHLNFKAYEGDLDEVVTRTLDQGVFVINVGSKYETSKKAVEMAEKYDGMYAAIGLHPIYTGVGVKIKTDPEEGEFNVREEFFDKEKYKSLLRDKVVAIGEIGLDYYYRPKTKTKTSLFKESQRKAFLDQLDFAKELNLPVIFHCRMAHDEMIEILQNQDVKGVIHCFTGDWNQAQKYLNMGFYLGINGIIDKLDLNEVIEKTPIDRILVETDCPYLTPKEEGDKRNEPLFVKHIIKRIADIRGDSFDNIAEQTFKMLRNYLGYSLDMLLWLNQL